MQVNPLCGHLYFSIFLVLLAYFSTYLYDARKSLVSAIGFPAARVPFCAHTRVYCDMDETSQLIVIYAVCDTREI